jgi:hypothetical protein
MIRVALPHHLQTLAKVGREIELTVEGPITIGAVLDRLEIQYLMLRGTIRASAGLSSASSPTGAIGRSNLTIPACPTQL